MKKPMFVFALALALSAAFSYEAKAQMICDPALAATELLPIRTNEACGAKRGNYLQRTVCNSPTYSSNAISLPKDRVAGCFHIVGFSGKPDWKIVDASGTVVFDPVMPTTAPRLGTLTLGEGTYQIKLNTATSSKGAWITLGFVDYPK
jgi:hypothetical protein